MRIGKLDTHPAADAFPMLDGPEHVALVEDVRKYGQREAIITEARTGLIVDGRNRARVCLELGVEPVAVPQDFDNTADVVAFVLSRNLHRRHLTPSQRAIVADRLAGLAQGQKRGAGDSTPTQSEAAKLLHVSERAVRSARELRESGRADLVDAVAAGKKRLARAVKEAKRDASAAALRGKPSPPPGGPFDVVEIDPPWRYSKNAAMAGTDADRRGEVDYPDMSEAEIIALDVPALLADDAIVWLWTTNAHMPEAARIAEAWGLEWKTILTWAKNKIGTGDWLRGATEHAILLTRGTPTVVLTNQSTLLVADTREHSRKPIQFYDLVEKLCPGSKLSMFSRERREGWTTWGVDVDKFESKPLQRTMEGV